MASIARPPAPCTNNPRPWRPLRAPECAPGVALAAAHAYLDRGWHPIPVAAGTKAPPKGFTWTQYRDRAPTRDELDAWWSRWPSAGVALVAGVATGLVVLDTDPRNGGPTSEAFTTRYGPTPTGPVVLSGRGDGGHHRYFAAPSRVVLRDTPDLAPGLDLKAHGYVIAAPSLHAVTGDPYRWVEGTEGLDLPELPDWVLSLAAERAPSTPKGATSGRHAGTEGPSLAPALADEWRALWGSVGVALADGERLYVCPWHDDGTPSLSIHAERGVWCCHAGCGRGGVRDLRARLALPQVRPPNARVSLWACKAKVLSPRSVAVAKPIEKSAHSLAAELRERCGRLAGFVVGGRRQAGNLACDRRTCPHCGPRRAARIAAPVLHALELGAALNEVVVTPDRWRAVSVRITRAGAHYKRYPMADGRSRVFTTWSFGAPVEDPAAAMRAAFAEAAQCRGRNITASRAWKVTEADEEGTPTGDDVVFLGYLTASPEWLTRQTHRITGHAMVPVVDTTGRVIRAACALTEAELTAAQRVALDVAWGIVTPAEWHAERREHRGEVLTRRLVAVAV